MMRMVTPMTTARTMISATLEITVAMMIIATATATAV